MQAQVHRFTVIYTPDIRKKSKRWYDGEITFHTFNKRVRWIAAGTQSSTETQVMLFSSDKLLLDSAFLPHFTGLDIDEELRLETHSVQIQEKGKSSMVDLTPILKRKRVCQQLAVVSPADHRATSRNSEYKDVIII